MDAQGVRSIDDISRLTPGITFVRNALRNPLSSDIAIRGVSSVDQHRFPVQWVIGFFYRKSDQISVQKVEDQFLPNLYGYTGTDRHARTIGTTVAYRF